MANIITHLKDKYSHAQQFMLQKGLKVFKDKGEVAAKAELSQLHKRMCFKALAVKELTQLERQRAQEGLMLLTRKQSGDVKGRLAYNGKRTRDWISKEDKSSPTVSNESIMITCAIDAYEKRNIITLDIPNAFIQTKTPKKEVGERIMMKIRGRLVDWLVNMSPTAYKDYVVIENGQKGIYLEILRAIYGMLEVSILWYKKFRKDLESVGFKFNPYDACVAN